MNTKIEFNDSSPETGRQSTFKEFNSKAFPFDDEGTEGLAIPFRVEHSYKSPDALAGSPAYLSIVRKRKARNLRKIILDIKLHSNEDTLSFKTEAAVEYASNTILSLRLNERGASDMREGNSCEIFRCIRDSFLNLGWQQYSNEVTCEAVAEVLAEMAENDDIDPADVDRIQTKLSSAGLNPVLAPWELNG